MSTIALVYSDHTRFSCAKNYPALFLVTFWLALTKKKQDTGVLRKFVYASGNWADIVPFKRTLLTISCWHDNKWCGWLNVITHHCLKREKENTHAVAHRVIH